jgi:hypothetical protein
MCIVTDDRVGEILFVIIMAIICLGMGLFWKTVKWAGK